MPRINRSNKKLLSRPDRIDQKTRGLVKLSNHPEMRRSGIYEISIEGDNWIEYPKERGQVIYIGKAQRGTTILQRLKEHRARERGNPNLYSFFKYKVLKIRYFHLYTSDQGLRRKEEIRLQDHFNTHGNVPIANRQGPQVHVQPGD
tara:strand:+ start:97 stop:534 length:438 start_codon:yes stop_codon:yes gene_type:complete